MLYEFKLGHSAADAARNINFAWGPETVLERTAQNWFARFRSGDTDIENKPGQGRSSSINHDDLGPMLSQTLGKQKKT